MKKYIFTACFSLLALIFFTGCKKFLDQKPKGVIFPSRYQDYDLLLNNMSVTVSFPGAFFYLQDDVRDAKSLSENTPSAYAYFWKQSLDPDDQADPSIWGKCYNVIYNANIVINNVLNLNDGSSPEMKQQLWAEALTIKATAYFDLLTAFAKYYNAASAAQDPGIPLVNDIDVTQKVPPRASLKECMDTIISYLTTAAPLLSNQAFYVRANKNTANGLLSRVYLYTGDYEKSKSYAEKVLASRSTLTDYNTIPFDDYGFFVYYYYPAADQDKEMLWTRFSDQQYFDNGPFYLPEFLATFDDNDLRKFIFPFDAYFDGNYSYSLFRPSFGLRLSEAYYNKAEALARAGAVQDAMDIINQVRRHRYKTGTYYPLQAANKEAAITHVLEERKKDLAFSGLRWMDMKRLNAEGRMPDIVRRDESGAVLATLKAGSSYTFEIPRRVLMFNPGMQKNF